MIKEPRISNKMETVIYIGMWVKNFLRLISSDLFLERGDKKNFSIFLNLIPRLSSLPGEKAWHRATCKNMQFLQVYPTGLLQIILRTLINQFVKSV